MPELPEVETMRRGILAAVGCRVTAVEKLKTKSKSILVQPRGASLAKRIVGRQIASVDRHGKRVVLRMDSDDRLIFEPRMTGLVLVADPPSVEHLRFRVDLAGGALEAIWYWDRRGLGSVQLLSPAEFSKKIVERLGPDALATTIDEFRNRLAPSRRPIKVALLDQQAIAGIGNLYASEILNVARVHPATPCHRVSRDAWPRIHAATQSVLNEAIHYEGSTLSDGTYRNVLNDAGGYQSHHRVYDRAGQRCRGCRRGEVQRIVQAQRSTFYCPHCQGKRRR